MRYRTWIAADGFRLVPRIAFRACGPCRRVCCISGCFNAHLLFCRFWSLRAELWCLLVLAFGLAQRKIDEAEESRQGYEEESDAFKVRLHGINSVDLKVGTSSTLAEREVVGAKLACVRPGDCGVGRVCMLPIQACKVSGERRR